MTRRPPDRPGDDRWRDPPDDDLLPERDGDLSDADLDALYRMQPVARPPADFADRLFAADPPRRRWSRYATAGALAALAAAAAIFVWRAVAPPQSGAVDAAEITTARLADRATAVADPGARFEWDVAEGAVQVRQSRGRVFYRVDGGPLTVHTPAGDVAVTGTCFTVEVESMSPALKAAALGALAGIAATVVVYEGAVRVSNERGEVELKPGERGRLVPEAPPVRADDRRIAVIAPVAPVPPVPPVPAAPPVPGLPALAPPAPRAPGEGLPSREELQALVEETRAELERVRRSLDDERAMRTESEGAPMKFPADLPERFGEEALRTRMQDAFTQSGVTGEVVSIDCSEFPCVVYAELAGDQERGHEELLETDAMAPYGDDAKSISVWGSRTKEDDGETRQRNFVGMALLPKGAVEGEDRRALDKRLQFRNQQAVEAFMPPPGELPHE